MTRAVFDYDYLKYSIASVCEKRSIVVTHRESGNEKEFPTRTEFYGHYLKKSGGWLAERNKERTEQGKEPWVAEDFDIADKQVAEPVSHMNNIVKAHINGVVKALGASSYYGYIGKGESWRVGASTILEYKGQRKENIKPLMLDEIEDYLRRRHDAEIITGLEADDMVIIDSVKNPKLTIVGVDKDYNGCEPINLFNPDTMSMPLRIEGLGKLWIEEKKNSKGKIEKKVRGMGRKFFYFQILSGDESDNYCANSATDTKWGDMGTFKLLDSCGNDAECWQAIFAGYKKLYPEPKEITGWRGDKFMVDWKYVLNENCVMAYMLRTPDDKFEIQQVFDMVGE